MPKSRIRGPITLLLGLIVAAGAVALVAGLRGQFAHWTAEQWRAQLHQVSDDRVHGLLVIVAELGEPGIPVLVEAFGSGRESVARAGKEILIEEVNRWELLSPAEASRRLAILAESLADRIDQFGPTAKSEAAKLATRILLWPLDEKAVDRGRIVGWCDRILRVSAGERRLLDANHRSGGVTRLLVGGDPAETYGENHERNMVSAAGPDSPDTARDAETGPEALPLHESPTVMQLHSDHTDNSTRLRVADVPPSGPRKQVGIEVAPLERLAQLFSVGDKNAQETGAPDQTTAGNKDQAHDQPDETDPIVGSLQRANTMTVMKQLRSADQRIAAVAEVELTRRGFSGAHLELARWLFHPDPLVRQRVGRAVLETPGINPVPWLVELSRDDASEVRLTAVTLMATTAEPTLMSQIEEIARRDPSERVRRQAQRIAENRRQTMY